jgi:hypothetical protein
MRVPIDKLGGQKLLKQSVKKVLLNAI